MIIQLHLKYTKLRRGVVTCHAMSMESWRGWNDNSEMPALRYCDEVGPNWRWGWFIFGREMLARKYPQSISKHSPLTSWSTFQIISSQSKRIWNWSQIKSTCPPTAECHCSSQLGVFSALWGAPTLWWWHLLPWHHGSAGGPRAPLPVSSEGTHRTGSFSAGPAPTRDGRTSPREGWQGGIGWVNFLKAPKTKPNPAKRNRWLA